MLYPASKQQMEAPGALKNAYAEMLNGCLAHPSQWEWYAVWMIELKDGTHIGEMCFKGITENVDAEIGYGIAEEHRRRGYGSEADNIASQSVLRKAGFIPTAETGEEGPIFVRLK